MNADKLISEIYKRDCLWNQAHPDHHNRFVLEKKWEEVSSALDTTKDIVKSKWKYLRDTFRKELAKCVKPRSGDAGGFTVEPKWSYYKGLLFLKDQFTPRKTTCNLTATLSCANQVLLDETQVEEADADFHTFNNSAAMVDEYDSQEDIDLSSMRQSPASTNESRSSSENRVVLESRKRKKPTDLIGHALLNVEKEKLKLLQNKEKRPLVEMLDEDRCFFESILPHVQKMEPLKKLQFRNRIQELLMLHAYDHSPTSGHCSPSAPAVTPPDNTFNYAQW